MTRGKPREYKEDPNEALIKKLENMANKVHGIKTKQDNKLIKKKPAPKETDPNERIIKKLENMKKQIEERQTKQREERRKQDNELIKIASESKKKSVSKDTQNLERTDSFIRRGYIKLKEPEDKEAFNQRLNLALQRPINNEVKKSDNTEHSYVE